MKPNRSDNANQAEASWVSISKYIEWITYEDESEWGFHHFGVSNTSPAAFRSLPWTELGSLEIKGATSHSGPLITPDFVLLWLVPSFGSCLWTKTVIAAVATASRRDPISWNEVGKKWMKRNTRLKREWWFGGGGKISIRYFKINEVCLRGWWFSRGWRQQKSKPCAEQKEKTKHWPQQLTSLDACLIISCSSSQDLRNDHWSRLWRKNSYIYTG